MNENLRVPTATPVPTAAPPEIAPLSIGGQQGARGIRRCLFTNTYIWLNNGQQFWYFPTFVTRQRISGFRWGRLGWVYHSINPNQVWSFQCM
ncbi:hypothetical protein SAMN04488134_10478 [Amphibacillus marinus]|uniref:Transporter n=1 Tax=Amphibacillus marinus TaxID=872970 RepID=A0A1H8M999_9BACI|nr:transporter [Amphibacillus marinus]SEO13941.1 hypothetical protein SAMN04488134_10478 [Amphibacillus marinus]